MAVVLRAEVVEAGLEEDSGYFYQRLGELRFSPEAANASEEVQHGHHRRLAVASKHGVVAFADQKGVYVSHLRNLISAATKGEEDQELPQVNAKEVCACTLPMSDASLALSSEEDLLAAWDIRTVKIWSLGALIQSHSSEPLTEWVVPDGMAVKQLAWRPSQAHGAVPEAAVLTVEGQLLRGSLGGQLQPLQDVTAGRVSCIAWSADGSLLALASASCVTVQHLKSGRHFRTEIDSKEATDADGVVNVDSLAWLGSQSLLISANLHPVEDLTAEMDIAPLAVMQWSTWDIEAGADPGDLQLVEFIAPAVNADATAESSGPYTHVARVPAWGAAVVAHTKASDDHIRLYEVGQGHVKAIDVTEDWSAIRIPSAMDYSDNYVTGLGMDFTSMDIQVMPPDPEASALPPSPVLLVATSDGALRLFTLAHMTKSTEGVVAPALPLSNMLPPMVAPEEQAEAPHPEVQERAAGVSLPPADGEESEEESPTPAVTRPRPAAAPEDCAAATALPASSEEDSYESSAKEESETSSSSAAADRAAHTALPPDDESDLADDADSGPSRADSSTADQRPSISRLDISRQADSDDEAESVAPFGPLSGRKLDFGSAETQVAEKAHKKPTPAPPAQKQEPATAAPLPWTLPTPSTATAAVTPAAASTSGFSFGSMPAFGGGSTDAFKSARLAGSSAAASSGTGLGSVPSFAPPTMPAFSGSAPGFASGTAASANSILSKTQVPSALPSQPPQSTAQKLIAKAREAEATKAAAANTSAPPPQLSKPAATPRIEPVTAAPPAKEPARLMAATAAQKRSTAADEKAAIARQQSKQQHAVTAAPQKPPAPEARLKGESRELAAMEADFLKTLAETRELEQAFSAAMAKTDGDTDSGPGTRLGFQSLVSRTQALRGSVAGILQSLATEKQRFGKLHNGWREDRARAEALLYFKGKHSNETLANGSIEDGDVLDPVLQELTASIDIQLQALQKQSSQLNDCLKALEERASMRQNGNSPRASTQQLYNAVNAQTAVAVAQLERLEQIWAKLHDMGISRDEDDEDSSDLPPPFPYSGTPSASKPSNSYADTPTISSRRATWRTWQQVRKSPLGRAKPRRPMALSPLIGSATPNASPWASDSANSLRRLLLEKVSMEGGVRLTRINGVTTLPPPQPNGQEESQWTPSEKSDAASMQPSALPPPVPAASPSPFGFGSSSSPFHDARSTAKPPSLAPSFGQSAGLTRAGSSGIGVDRIQPQAAPIQKDGTDSGYRKRQPSPFQAINIPDPKEQLARRESATSADSSGSTASAPLCPKHARASDTAEQPQVPPSNFRPFQRQATGFSLARAGSAAFGHAEPADSSDSAAGSTNKGPEQGQATLVPPVQAVAPKSVQAGPSAAKMPPVPSRAALAAAQAQAQAALQRAAPSSSAKMPPVPSRTAVAAAQAQGEAALRESAGPSPAAKTPPIPSRSAVAAAQALGQAALQKTTAAPAAKVPPVPSKAALAAAQAQGEAALQKKAPAPAAKMPPVPSRAALEAAQAQAQVALQKAPPGTKRGAEATSKPAPAAGSAQPAFNFANFNFGDAASPTAPKPASQPFGLTAQSSAAFSFASAMSMSSPAAAATTTSSSVASQAAFPIASLAPTSSAAPASFQIATNLATSQPSLGLYGASAAASTPAPAPAVSTAAASGIGFGAPLSGGFGTPASPGVANMSRFGQQAAAPSIPPTSAFGSQAPTPSTSAFGTLSFGASASQQAATPSSLASGFGAFGGLGQPAPAASSAASPFGKGLSLGASSATSAPTPFAGGFGQPSSSSAAAAGFAGFGQTAPAFGQPQTPVSPAPPSSGAFSWGFGQSTGISAQPSAVGSGFGQPSMMGSAFGQPASPGLGQTANPSFGTPATPGFGAPVAPGFGSPASPLAPFGGATGSNAFGAAAAQGSSGFGAFASMAGKPSPFGAAAQTGGGFAAAAQPGGGGFGGFGGGSTFGAASTPAASPGNSDMWQMRK